jgi:uncharacterized protein (TIGR02611 family)
MKWKKLHSAWVCCIDPRQSHTLFPENLIRYSAMFKYARRIVILIVGMTVLLVGVALLFLPGPAIVVIPVGLAILATEFAWARHWLRIVRESAEKGAGKLKIRSLFSRSTGLSINPIRQSLAETRPKKEQGPG